MDTGRLLYWTFMLVTTFLHVVVCVIRILMFLQFINVSVREETVLFKIQFLLFLGCGLASRQRRGRISPVAALPLVDTGTKMLVPAAGKQIAIRHSRRGSSGGTYGETSVSFHSTTLENVTAFSCVVFLHRFVLYTLSNCAQRKRRARICRFIMN